MADCASTSSSPGPNVAARFGRWNKTRALRAFGIQVTASPGDYRFTVSLLRLSSDDCRESFEPWAVWFDAEGNEHPLSEYPGLDTTGSLEAPDYSDPGYSEEVEAILRGLEDDQKQVRNLEAYILASLQANGAHSSTKRRFTTIEQTSA